MVSPSYKENERLITGEGEREREKKNDRMKQQSVNIVRGLTLDKILWRQNQQTSMLELQ